MKFFNSTISLAAIAAFLFCFTACTQNKLEKKPNIIFLFADDQCYNTIHALGNPEVLTPNLDKLSEQGVTFTHAYNMGAWNGAVCLASRAMLNTGRSVWRAYGYEANQQDLVDKGEMWGLLMQNAGYETYMSGKWHVKTAAEKLFNHVTHVRPGMPGDAWPEAAKQADFGKRIRNFKNHDELMPIGYNRPQNPGDTSWQPWDKKFGGFWEGGRHWSEVLGDDAINYINAAKNQEKPFFMYLAFNAPHDPRQSPKEFVDKYPLENVSVPKSFQTLYPYRDSIGCGPGLRDAALAPFPRTEYSVKVNRQEYYAIITHMDEQIGRILKVLEESGEMDNTYIFYSADHGLAVGNHGLIGKQNMYDHSIRVPLFVIGPDVPKNEKIDVDVYLQDIMASTLDVANIAKPEYIEFNSLMPFVNGEKSESNYSSIYGCYQHDLQRMVRKDGFKLIVYPHGKTMRLYDLKTDPDEINDLGMDEKYNDKKKELFEELLKLQKQMDDPLDLKEVFPEV